VTEASFADLCQQLADNTWLLGLLIAVGVCFLEDAGRCAVGLMVAAGHINWWTAFVWMIFGSLIGDYGLYLIGRYAMAFVVGRRWVNAERIQKMKGYFSNHAVKAIIGARFLPGFRTLAFCAAGATHYKIAKFTVVLSLVTLAQTLIFLYATEFVGARVIAYLENPAMRRAVVGIILALMIAGHFIVARRKKRLKKI